jgi:hypothetical protein
MSRHTIPLLALLLATLVALPAAAQQGAPAVDVGGYGAFRYELSDAVRGSFTLRRFALTTDARWRDRLQLFSEVGYERLSGIGVARSVERLEDEATLAQRTAGGGEIALEQAWAQLRLGPVTARAGAVLPPVGRFNLHHQDHVWNFPRRPLPEGAALALPVPATWTEVGFGLLGEHAVGAGMLLAWQAFVVNGMTFGFTLGERITSRETGRSRLVIEAELEPTQGAFDGSATADALAGRVALTSSAGAEIALSGYTGIYTPDFLDADARVTTVGLDGRARLGALVVEGEILSTRYEDVDRVVTDFARVVHDQASTAFSAADAELETQTRIALAGLANRRSGLWLDLSWPVALPPGTLGFESAALAPIARYEHVRLDGDVTELTFADGRITQLVQPDREQARLAVGLALRPVPEAVIQLVYEVNRARAGAMIEPAVVDRLTSGLVAGLAVGF